MKVELDEHAKMFVQAVLALIGMFTLIGMRSCVDDKIRDHFYNNSFKNDQYACVIISKYIDAPNGKQTFFKCRDGQKIIDIPVENDSLYDAAKSDDTIAKIKGTGNCSLIKKDMGTLTFNCFR